MTTKTELLEELKKSIDVIQQKIAEIEKEEDNEKQDNCLIKTPRYIDKESVASYIYDYNDSFVANIVSCSPKINMHFADEEQCARYAEALTTFILLRKQPGSEVAKEAEQFVLRLCGVNVYVDDVYPFDYKISLISPCFKSEESARKAIETLGEERILDMFKYFHS